MSHPAVGPVLNISCLHSAQSNIEVFEAARRALKLDDVMLRHRVRADLLTAAEKAGRATEAIIAQTADELRRLAAGSDALLLTCSTLGPAAANAAAELQLPVFRVDEALAAEAVADGGRVLVLCAVGTTIGPTRAIFEAAAMKTGAEIEVRLVPGAWNLFRSGDREGYWQAIAGAADSAATEQPSAIALAQASMAGAVAFCREANPLASPPSGLAAAVAAAHAARRIASEVKA